MVFSPSNNKKYTESEIYFRRTLPSLSEEFSPPAIDKRGNVYFGFKNSLYVLSSTGKKMLQKDFIPSSCNPQQIQWNNTHIGYTSVVDESTIYIEVVGEKYEGCGGWSEGWRGCIHFLSSEDLQDKINPICDSQYPHKAFSVDNERNLYIAPAYYCAFCGGFAYPYLYIISPNGSYLKNVGLAVYGLPSDLLVDSEKMFMVFFLEFIQIHL